MKKYLTAKTFLIALVGVNALIIAANFIYVTPPIVMESKPLPQGRPDDVAAIKHLEQLTADGWAAGDGELMASAFTTDADYVTFNGEWLTSREEIAALHQELFDTVLKGSSIANRTFRSIRFLSDDVALVHVTGAVKQRGRRTPAESRNSIQTLVAVKDDGTWKVTAFHNARISRVSLWDGIKMSFN